MNELKNQGLLYVPLTIFAVHVQHYDIKHQQHNGRALSARRNLVARLAWVFTFLRMNLFDFLITDI